ncbi:MAG TPA: hypothetical protein VGB67_12725, partial [Fibrella sp.]
TINETPDAPTPQDITVCDSYTLPVLPAGQTYHSASGGNPATSIPAGTVITTTQTICIFAQSGTTPNCTSEGCFTVTVNQTPPTPVVADVTACDTYALPALPAGSSYHNFSGGGSPISPPTISGTQPVWVFSQTGTDPNCFSEASFTVTINETPDAPTPQDITVCDSYTLPVLPAGQTYHSASGGDPATVIPEGTVVTTTQTICIFAQSGTTPNCTSEGCFTVTVNQTPPTPVVADVTACDSYTLPALPAGSTCHNFAGGIPPLAPATITETQQVWVFSQTGTDPNCFSQASFLVTINDTPPADAPSDVVACDSYQLPFLNSGSYYTQPGGQGTNYAGGEILTQSVLPMYVYAETGTMPNCFTQNSFDITIYTTPVAMTPTTLQICDDNTDGFGCFDLTAAANEIIQNNTDWSVSFHETQTDASNGVTAVDTNYCTILPGMQQLYVRVFNTAAPQCGVVVPLVLQVNPKPTANQAVQDYELCDVNNTGDEIEGFDLPSMDQEILGQQTGVEVTYYASEQDMQDGNPISAFPYENTSNPQQIWFDVSNPTTGCLAQGSFNIVVNPLPLVVAPPAMNECTDGISPTAVFDLTVNDNIATGAVAGMIVTYYTTLANAQSGTDQITDVQEYVSGAATIYIRVEDAQTGCYSTTSVELTVSQGPAAYTPSPLQVCDPNNDCFATFDLTQAYNDISNGPTPAGVTITFHETATDAATGANPVPTTYFNINPCTQTLYVRVAFDFTGCANFTELQLIVNPTPEANEDADALEVCDDDYDGIGVFNLSLATANVLNGLDAAQFTVTYYTTQGNAESATSPIQGTLAFTSSSTVIWVRVENNTTHCFDVVPLELIVNPLPTVVFPIPSYTLCDLTGNDQQEVFDLESQIPMILNNQTGISVSFHATDAQAQAGTDPLPLNYQNPAGQPATTLHVRLTNDATDCYVVSTMDVRVEPLPELIAPMPDDPLLTACDADMDCFASFDLDALIPDMLGGATGITVTFFETQTNAETGEMVNALSSPYTNINPCNQTIYVRAQYDASPGCFSVISIELNVTRAPAMPQLEDQARCDADSNNQNGSTNWNLTNQEAAILAAQSGPPANYEINYYTSQANAELGQSPIINPANFTNGTNPQTICVSIEDLTTGCRNTGCFTLSVNAPLVLTTPSALAMCDYEPNTTSFPQEVFDLTIKDAEILGAAGVAGGYTVQYFVTQADMFANQNAISPATAYPNITNAQTLWVAVTGPDPTNCRSFTTMTIHVYPLPQPLLDPQEIEVCDDTAPTGTEPFDLTINEEDIADGDLNMIFEYYPTLEDANAQTNEIIDPTNHETGTGIIYIRVMRIPMTDFNGDYCYVIVEQPVKVNELPVIQSPAFLDQCETDGNGIEVFDLTQANEQLIVSPLNVADYTFTYYETQAQAEAGTGSIGSSYENETPFLQDVYVVVTNADTKCKSVVGVITLAVKVGATAAEPTTDFFNLCDTDTDGILEIDLTQADAEILGTQDPAAFEVHYFATLADYTANVPIA